MPINEYIYDKGQTKITRSVKKKITENFINIDTHLLREQTYRFNEGEENQTVTFMMQCEESEKKDITTGNKC